MSDSVLIICRRQADGDANVKALFPNEEGGGVLFSREQIEEHNGAFRALYQESINIFAKQLVKLNPHTVGVAPQLTRAGLVPLLHCFFERFLRLEKLLANTSEDFVIGRARDYDTPQTCEEFFRLSTHDFDFNQLVLQYLSDVFNLPLTEVTVEGEISAEPLEFDSNYQNHMFVICKPTLAHRIKRRLTRRLSTHIGGGILATRLTYTELPSIDGGLYGPGGFSHLADIGPLPRTSADTSVRLKFFSDCMDSLPFHDAIEEFLGRTSVRKRLDQGVIVKVMKKFFIHFYPATLLEGVNANLAYTNSILKRYPKSRVLYSSGISLNASMVFLVAAAKKIGWTIIGSQHGGHHGYLMDHVLALETEMPFCDYFVTWGWGKDAVPNVPDTTTLIPLPSPMFSSKSADWNKVLNYNDRYAESKKFDFTFLPNKVYPFTPPPSGAHATSNHLRSIIDDLSTTVSRIVSSGRSLRVKPYGRETVSLMPRLYKQLSSQDEPRITVSRSISKGISLDLIQSSRLILWDQPGTGFMECLSGDIPTMVYWRREYNEELSSARDVFDWLERLGIVHKSLDRLLESSEEFFDSPQSWWEDGERGRCRSEFMNRYGRIDEDWARTWRSFLGNAGSLTR